MIVGALLSKIDPLGCVAINLMLFLKLCELAGTHCAPRLPVLDVVFRLLEYVLSQTLS